MHVGKKAVISCAWFRNHAWLTSGIPYSHRYEIERYGETWFMANKKSYSVINIPLDAKKHDKSGYVKMEFIAHSKQKLREWEQWSLLHVFYSGCGRRDPIGMNKRAWAKEVTCTYICMYIFPVTRTTIHSPLFGIIVYKSIYFIYITKHCVVHFLLAFP